MQAGEEMNEYGPPQTSNFEDNKKCGMLYGFQLVWCLIVEDRTVESFSPTGFETARRYLKTMYNSTPHRRAIELLMRVDVGLTEALFRGNLPDPECVVGTPISSLRDLLKDVQPFEDTSFLY